MGKKVKYVKNDIIDLRASDGVDLDVGGLTLEYCDVTKTAVVDDEEEGWRAAGIVSNEIDLKPAIEAFEAMASGMMMDKSQLGKKVEFDVTLIAPKDLIKAIWNGNTTVTYNEPSPAVATTVDLTTSPAFAPNHRSIRVTSITDFIGKEGKDAVMLTGTAATGQEYERMTIAAIDATNKIIFFKDGYENLPEDEAEIKLIDSVEFTNEGVTIPSLKIRLRKKDHGKKAVTLYNYKTVKFEPTGRKLGVKAPSDLSFKLSVIPDPTIVMSSTSTTEVTYNWGKEKTIL